MLKGIIDRIKGNFMFRELEKYYIIYYSKYINYPSNELHKRRILLSVEYDRMDKIINDNVFGIGSLILGIYFALNEADFILAGAILILILFLLYLYGLKYMEKLNLEIKVIEYILSLRNQ